MNRTKKGILWKVTFSLCLIIFALSIPVNAAVLQKTATNNIHMQPLQRKEISRIIGVLERTTGDRKLALKAREKLETLSAEDIRLISSLCSQIRRGESEPGSDIAFTMVSILLILL